LEGDNTCKDHSGCVAEINSLKIENKEQWDKINVIIVALNTRLPIWATFLIALQTGAIGWLVK